MSPFISPDEAAVRDVALREGLPMIYILDNGLPIGAKYKPPGNLIEDRRRAASSPLSLATLCARQKPLYPRRVYRHERDGGDHRFSRYSESGEATNRTEIV